MTVKTISSSSANRLFVGASLKAGYLFAHAADASRPAFAPVLTPPKIELVVPDASSGPQDQWGIAPQVIGNTQLMAILRVPVGASCVIVASSYTGVTGYSLDRKNGDTRNLGRMGRANPVPFQPSRQKAGKSVESGAGVVGPYGTAAPAVLEVPAAPVNRDFVIVGGADLFVEVYTDSRPTQEVASPNAPFVVREIPVSDGTYPGHGSIFNVITVSPVIGASPWYAATSFRSITDLPGTVKPFINTIGRGTVDVTGVPALQVASQSSHSLPHRLITQLLSESEAPYYSAKFAIIGLAFLPDAEWVYANASVAPTTPVLAKDLFINDQPTYNPGPTIAFSSNYGFAALGAAN